LKTRKTYNMPSCCSCRCDCTTSIINSGSKNVRYWMQNMEDTGCKNINQWIINF
jgi:hypothetical protein